MLPYVLNYAMSVVCHTYEALGFDIIRNMPTCVC